MELYYHVTTLERGKSCVFEFCYIGGRGRRIRGRVTAQLPHFHRSRRFDADSCLKLSEAEKDYIISAVAKNVLYK